MQVKVPELFVVMKLKLKPLEAEDYSRFNRLWRHIYGGLYFKEIAFRFTRRSRRIRFINS